MNYKITKLPKQVSANEHLLPEIAGLNCCILTEEQAVFDYTAYFEENELPPIDIRSFMQVNKRYIEELSKSFGANTSKMFFQNMDGHYLVDYTLVILFLAFANPDILRYFNSLLGQVLTDGVAFSNSLIYRLAVDRLPTEILQDIIKDRDGDSKPTDTGSGI